MFDPYHKWLAIPRDQRPPTHYQMLGISPSEQDAEVIDEAALRQIMHVRAYQIGQHAAESQRILNELSQARTVLLNPEKRKAYDETLAKQSSPASAAASAPEQSPPDLAAAISKQPLAPPAASTPAADPWEKLDGVERRASRPDALAVPSVRKPVTVLPLVLILGGGAGVIALGLVLVIAFVAFWRFQGAAPQPANPAVVQNVPQKKKMDAAPVVVPPAVAPPVVAPPRNDPPPGNDAAVKPPPFNPGKLPPPPAKDLIQPADVVIPLEVSYRNMPRELLFSDAKHHLVGVVEPGDDKTANLVLYDLAAKQKVSSTPVINPNFSPCSHDLSPDGKYYSQATLSRKRNIWAIGNAEALASEWTLKEPVRPGSDDGILAASCFIEGDRLLTVSAAGSVEIWQLPALKSLLRIPAPKKQRHVDGGGVQVSPDRRRCAIFTGTSYRIIDTGNGKPVCETQALPPVDAKSWFSSRTIAFSADGTSLVAGIDAKDFPPALYCYDAVTGAKRSSVAGPEFGDNRLMHGRVGWVGADHFSLTSHGIHPLTLYRAADAAPVASIQPDNRTACSRYSAPDQRFWFKAQAAGAFNANLVGVELAEVLRGQAGPPVSLRLTLQGLTR